MEEHVRAALAQALRVGNRRALALCHHALGAVLQLSGRWPAAVRALNESIELCRSFAGEFGEVLGEQRLAQIETAIGRFEPGYQRLQRILDKALASSSPMVRMHSFGRIYAGLSLNRLEAGDLARATHFLASGFETQRSIGECASCDLLLYPAAVPIYLAHGELDLAEASCLKAQQTATLFGSRSWVAASHHLLGLLAAHRGAEEEAALHLEQAAASFASLCQPYERARSLESLALLRSKAGAPEAEVRSLAATAAGLYEGLGAPARAARLKGLLSS